MPSPNQFDHLISVVEQGEDFLWLDTTTEVAPFGLLGANLRGKLALVIPEGSPARLVKTAADPPFLSFYGFEVEGKLSETGTLEAKVQSSIRGDAELLFRSAFRNTPQPQWNELVQSVSFSLGFGGTVSDVSASAPEATDTAFSFAYTYTRKDYSDWGNRRITVPFPPLYLPVLSGGRGLAQSVQLGAPQEVIYRARVELPPGYTPRLPPPVHLKKDFAEYRSTYNIANNVLQVERHLTIRVRELPADRSEDYRTFQHATSKDENAYINFREGPAVELTDFGGTENAEAEEAFNQGTQAMQRRAISAAAYHFQGAVRLDPNYARAWLALGMAHMMLRDFDSSIEAFRKAIQFAPDQPAAYKPLAFALMSMHRSEEAIQVWRELLRVDPQDGDASTNLGTLLVEEKRYTEAVTAFEAAVRLNPQTARLHMMLGHAYLRAGDKEKGLASLQKAVELEPGPPMWNTVAQSLAETNSALPEALAYAEKAVTTRETETAAIRLNELKADDLRRMAELGNTWSTLGWVHFRLGNLDKAEKYLYAAWMLSQEALVGDRLGQVYDRQQKTTAAAAVYAQALATTGPRAPAETRGRLLRLLGNESKLDAAVNKAREELGRMRTIKLSRLIEKHVTAEFFVLFSPGAKVEEVKFIKGDEELQAATQALASARYEVPFPNGGPTRLVRRGILACYRGAPDCSFVLFTPDTVHSVN